MVRQTLRIGRWLVYFFFLTDDYDRETIMSFLETFDASDEVIQRVEDIMSDWHFNWGFTFSNPDIRRSVVVIGPSSSGAEFVNSLAHELHHLSVAIADSLGYELNGETPAYIQGDTMGEFLSLICELGCERCRG